MKRVSKNIGWCILIAIGIASAIYSYKHIALPFWEGALYFIAISFLVTMGYSYFIPVEEEEKEEEKIEEE